MKDHNMTGKPQVKKKAITWKQYLATYLVMMLLVGGQMTFLVGNLQESEESLIQLLIILLYWAVMSLLFCFITSRQLVKRFDEPMRKLSDAANKVASGDFSVYLETIHTPEKYDYIDVTFLDFNKMVQELGSIETLKNDFVANVSHEIKTPVAVIQNYASAIKDKNLTDEQREEYSDTIIDASKRLTALITNILKLNKLENQEIAPISEPFNLGAQISECAVQFLDMFEKKDIQFEADLDDGVLVQADESMMEIVWNNLFSNALKFTEAGGSISVQLVTQDRNAKVTVTDTGCGMSQDVMARVFDKFYQGDTSHASQGNGLGMALAQRVVERAGGTISVDSEIGKGTSFTVTLPVK